MDEASITDSFPCVCHCVTAGQTQSRGALGEHHNRQLLPGDGGCFLYVGVLFLQDARSEEQTGVRVETFVPHRGRDAFVESPRTAVSPASRVVCWID